MPNTQNPNFQKVVDWEMVLEKWDWFTQSFSLKKSYLHIYLQLHTTTSCCSHSVPIYYLFFNIISTLFIATSFTQSYFTVSYIEYQILNLIKSYHHVMNNIRNRQCSSLRDSSPHALCNRRRWTAKQICCII